MMTKTEDTTSVSEHQARLNEHLRLVKETGRPLFITADGDEGREGVLLSPDAYAAMRDEIDLAKSLRQVDASMDDIKAGRTRPAAESFAEGRRRLEERMAAAGIPGAKA